MNHQIFTQKLIDNRFKNSSSVALRSGSNVAVMGGGPAGSFFAYFILQTAKRVGWKLNVDIYEPRDFSLPGPLGCNYCAGVISESLVQNLAIEGINLSPAVVQRAIDSYVWHTDLGSLCVQIGSQESRIATVFRGKGPRGAKECPWESFDGYLLSMAKKKGAHVIPARVTDIERIDDGILVKAQNNERAYDLLAVAAGVNTPALKLFNRLDEKYKAPQTTKTAIREYYLGAETIQKYMGASLHVFLMDIPKLKFGMIAPKGDFATVCLLGHDIDDALLRDFLTAREVKACFPPDWNPDAHLCQCMPRLPVQSAIQPFADRVVFIGDSGVSRLYKDGIGAAFRAAKAAATTAILNGVSERDFKRHYAPLCHRLEVDNIFGKIIFTITKLIQRIHIFRKAVVKMVEREQKRKCAPRMGSVLWDTFTGSAQYRDIFTRALHPIFLLQLFRSFVFG